MILWRLLINAAGQDCILATEKMTVNPKFFQNDRPRVNNVVCEPFFLSLTRIREGVVNAKFSSTFQDKCPNYFTNFFQSIILVKIVIFDHFLSFQHMNFSIFSKDLLESLPRASYEQKEFYEQKMK